MISLYGMKSGLVFFHKLLLESASSVFLCSEWHDFPTPISKGTQLEA